MNQACGEASRQLPSEINNKKKNSCYIYFIATNNYIPMEDKVMNDSKGEGTIMVNILIPKSQAKQFFFFLHHGGIVTQVSQHKQATP